MLGEESTCPACGRVVRVHFCVVDCEEGPLWVASARCACGRIQRDAAPLGCGEHQLLSMSVRGAGDLGARVVRGPQASICIPEWGLRLDPGSEPAAFVTNVEGVLIRFQEAARRARALYADDASLRRLEELESTLGRARGGDAQFTLVVDDPLGQSRLGGDDAD